jgi:hypothetical protein
MGGLRQASNATTGPTTNVRNGLDTAPHTYKIICRAENVNRQNIKKRRPAGTTRLAAFSAT